jgi:hypothetical protein
LFYPILASRFLSQRSLLPRAHTKDRRFIFNESERRILLALGHSQPMAGEKREQKKSFSRMKKNFSSVPRMDKVFSLDPSFLPLLSPPFHLAASASERELPFEHQNPRPFYLITKIASHFACVCSALLLVRVQDEISGWRGPWRGRRATT